MLNGLGLHSGVAACSCSRSNGSRWIVVQTDSDVPAAGGSATEGRDNVGPVWDGVCADHSLLASCAGAITVSHSCLFTGANRELGLLVGAVSEAYVGNAVRKRSTRDDSPVFATGVFEPLEDGERDALTDNRVDSDDESRRKLSGAHRDNNRLMCDSPFRLILGRGGSPFLRGRPTFFAPGGFLDPLGRPGPRLGGLDIVGLMRRLAKITGLL